MALYRNGSKITSGLTIKDNAATDMTGAGNKTITQAIVAFSQEESIGAGQTNTYELRATVAGAGTGDSITTKIANGDEATEVPATVVVNNGNTNTTHLTAAAATDGLVTATQFTDAVVAGRNVLWSDKSQDTHVYSTTHTTSSKDFTNGYLLKVSNESAQTLSY